MADGIYVYVRDNDTQTVLQGKLEKAVNDAETRKGINEILLEHITKYVPEGETGKLRSTAYTTPDAIIWPQKYAHYQFVGEVYGPNFLIFTDNGLEWRSPKKERMKKRPMGWSLIPSKAGTGADWANEMWSNERRVVNIRITNYMKRRAKELGL